MNLPLKTKAHWHAVHDSLALLVLDLEETLLDMAGTSDPGKAAIEAEYDAGKELLGMMEGQLASLVKE